MSNNKVKISKTRILALLVIILAICVGLLTVTIFFQTRSQDTTIEQIENPAGGDLVLNQPLVPPKTAEDYRQSRTKHILRSENGKMQVSERNGTPVDFGSKTSEELPLERPENLSQQNQIIFPNGDGSAVAANGTGDGSAGSDGSILIEGEGAANGDGSVQGEPVWASLANSAASIDESTQALLNKTGPDWYDYSTGEITGQNYSITGTLVFVFDDAGHNLNQLQPFLELPFPVTVAVLPGLEYSAEAAKKVRSCGKEVILHQPMQAVDLKKDPGPGAIYPEMTNEQVYNIVRRNLASIGPVAGLNNHEGSLITANENLMSAVLDVCRAEQIYFLDSRTNSESKARYVAAQRGMRIWERSVFLDNTPSKKEMQAAVRLGMEQAKKNGLAIMIGHVWSEQLPEVLSDLYPEMLMQGYSIKTISKIQDLY